MALHVLINGKEAAIGSSASFEFFQENPLFTDSEGYSLNIDFPLKNCKQNLEIFGFINRHGHDALGRPVNMEIRSARNVFRGIGVIVSVTEKEVKVQFLSGKSADNYYNPLSETFINELDLGEIPFELRRADDVPVWKAWAGHAGGMDMVAIPYVNENSGNIINDTETIKNFTPSDDNKPGEDQKWKLPEEAENEDFYVMYLSWFPYLYDVAVKICEAIGFTFDFSIWRNSKWYDLLLCNAVPGTWDFKLNMLLPRWSVLEFFQNLEPLIEGYFDFDLIDNKITFRKYSESFNSTIVEIENVIDEFSSDVYDIDDSDCKLLNARYVGYAVSSNKAALAYSCDWLMDKYLKSRERYITEFETPEQLSDLAVSNNFNDYRILPSFWGRGFNTECFYLESVDRYVSNRVIQTSWWDNGWGESEYRNKLCYIRRVPLMFDVFGSRNVPIEEKKIGTPDLQIQFVPVVIDDTDMRRMIFMPLGEYDENFGEPMIEEDLKDGSTLKLYDSLTMRYLEEGNSEKISYFSNIAVGFYPGADACYRGNNEIFPIIDNFEMNLYWMPWYAEDKSLSLALSDSVGKFSGIPKVDTNTKFEFSFLSDEFPDVKKIFLIRGKRYLCEKLNATFSASGMSKKLKGTFWRII